MSVHPFRRLVRRPLAIVYVLLGLTVLAVLAAVPSSLRAMREARSGRELLLAAEQSLRQLDTQRARLQLDRADESFERAERALRSLPAMGARYLPGVGRQSRAVIALSRAGRHIADAGVAAAEAVEARPAGGWRLSGGRIDVDALARAAEPLRRSQADLRRARRTLEETSARFVAPPIGSQRTRALGALRQRERLVARAEQGLQAAPGLLGAEGRRRYFVALDNLAELRGTGGVIGFYAVLEADNGKLSLSDRTGRPQEEFTGLGALPLEAPQWYRDAYGRYGAHLDWANLNLTSDFPTVGDLIVQIASTRIGQLDGVIKVDPVALGSVLGLTGPVSAEGWPEALTSENVSRITQHDAYVRFAGNPERIEFLGEIVASVFERFLQADVAVDEASLGLLGRLTGGGHIQMYVTDPVEQAALEELGIAGSAGRARGATDVLGFVSSNSGGNKIDWFLRRDLRYHVRFDPRTNEADARLDVDLRNDAPGGGLPSYVIGSPDPSLRAGQNRTISMVLRHPDDALTQATIDDEPVQPSRDREGDLVAYQTIHVIQPGGMARVSFEGLVPAALRGSGRERVYRLHVLRQPLAHPDRLELDLEAPRGWRLVGVVPPPGPLESDVVVEVRLVHRLEAWLFERAVLGPIRLLRDLISSLF